MASHQALRLVGIASLDGGEHAHMIGQAALGLRKHQPAQAIQIAAADLDQGPDLRHPGGVAQAAVKREIPFALRGDDPAVE